jgi:adenosylcobyric acid synthase
MVLGTASSVGKSTLVAALCRIAARRGLRVAPFKAQNMSNNAAVTADGGEIGRSTAVQAAAAEIAPTVQMNPILLKPEGAHRSQIIVEGRPWRSFDALDYWRRKDLLWDVVTHNLDALRSSYDLVIAEGAGSPVELNLKPRDIVNTRVARYAQARTLLVGDIDCGGIFAQLLGTLMLLEANERALVAGLVVNRFRGDPALFANGVAILQERSRLPVLGVVPWIEDLRLAEEDAVALERGSASPAALTIAVLRLPAIANFDDFDPLAREPGVAVRYIDTPQQLAGAVAVIVPGTKHTLAARRWLRERGFDAALGAFPGRIVGICGGYQLLGAYISDPRAVEGAGGAGPGLGLLPLTTVFSAAKRTAQICAVSQAPWAVDAPLTGYEIHMGRSTAHSAAAPLVTITRRGQQAVNEPDGLVADGGRIWGCYIHGLFANDAFRQGWLHTLGWQPTATLASRDPYDRLADTVATALDPLAIERLLAR